MQSTTQGSFDANTHFQNEPHQFPHPPASSFGSSVTVASPAKRITFYKSGNAQFKGIKMAIHKRSFRCFDALLDDLSQKVPLPFGVRTITTPRGTHSIKHLEQLEDGGCYLCSDHRYVKPINMEAAGKRPAVWHHHSHPHNTRRKPSRPEEPPSGHQHHHRHPKRIVLVKNNDLTVRRSIILSRRTARSLRVFMDEISELMQCHVKNLYTLEGRKIDNIQSLMQCPSVLVCVGREPFRPLLIESLKKLSDEKLPGMGTRSHSSVCSEGHESKKNVNFGLETKKSIIHPRSDSSNRSTRFSLSSEKSYQNGLCMTPGQSGCVSNCPYVKEFVVNDDIEKRVLVNKDGSLSVEMKVRFRLFNDETLQWSTEIKKSSANVNDSGSVKDADYLQGKAEYSDPDSISASETDEAFATKLHQKHIEETLCQNCCNHCQEYDIWKNPMHKEPGACKSPSSSASSHKVVHKKSSVDSTHTISLSSGEYTEHVVEKASCFQQTMDEGDTRVEYCAISRCCNRSEVSSVGVMSKSKRSCEDDRESHAKTKCFHMEPKISPTPHCKVMEERPVSAVSNSSKVIESLKEDQDDDYDDLPPSVSRASHWSQSDHLESDAQPKCVHCCGYQSSPRSYLSPRPPSKESSSAVQSLKLKKYKTPFAAPAEPDGMSMTSLISKASSRSHLCHCGAITPSSVASGRQHGLEGEACSANSRHSQASCKSRVQANSPGSNASDALEICDDDAANRSLSATSGVSKRSVESGVCSCCGEHKILNGNPEGSEPEEADYILSKPNKSAASTSNAHENCEPVNDISEREATRECSESALSKNSNASSTSKISKKSNCSTHEMYSVGKSSKSEHNEAESVGERTKSATPAVGSDCIVSEREPTPALVLKEMDKAEEKSQERAASPMSAHADLSGASRKSHTPKSAHSKKAKTPRCCSPNDLEEVPSNLFSSQVDISESAATQSHTTTDNHCGQDTEFPQEVRSASAMSNKSNRSSEHPSHASEQTTKSVKSCCGLQYKATQNISGPDIQCEPETEVTTEERLCSPLSNCSKISVKSHASSKYSHAESKSEKRVSTAMSVQTNTSKGSCRSRKSNYNVPETTVTSEPNDTTPNECATPKSESNRAISAMSQTSEKSNACSERSIKSNGKSLASQEVKNGKDMTQNALSVTSPLPRSKRSPSPRSTHNNEIKKNESRAPSGMSVSSNLSLQSQRSSKCHCHSSSSGNLRETKIEILKEDAKGESESLSGKSKLSTKSLIYNIKSSGNQLDEPLSPTSTASVSLGLVEEHKGDDFDEQSTSDMSHRRTQEAGYTLETENGVDAEERPRTEMSMNSAISDKSKKSHHKNCKTPVQALSPVSAESVMSAELKKSKSGSQLNENNIRVPSSSRSKSPSRVSQGSTKNTAMKERDCETVNIINHAEINETSSKNDRSERTSGKANPESDCLNSSKASEHSVKSKNGHNTKDSDRSKCKRSKCSSQCLEINGLNIKYNGDNDGGTVKSSTSDRTSVKNEASRPNSAGMSDISQNCVSLPQEMPNKNIASLKHPGSSSDSVLSQALSAADLLKEIVGNARPVSRGSKSVASSKNVDKVENKSQKSSRSKHSKVSISSECNNKELMPSCLTNTSSTEVVSDWLRNIPLDGHVYKMDVELTEDVTLAQGGEDTSQRDQFEASKRGIIEIEKPHDDQADVNHIQLVTNDIYVETELCDERAQLKPDREALTKQDSLQKQCHSSVQVMKVLLGPKLDRSSSLPEVSPVYGRKLSQSAQGLLDCFANLRLIDSDSKKEKHHKYNEIMLILQSLWLQKPSEDEQKNQNAKEHPSAEDEFNPQSSSGVDVSSGSTGSVKGSMNGVLEKIETTQGTIPPIAEREGSLQNKEEDEVKSTAQACECLDPSKVPSDPVTPDLAERVQGSPVNAQLNDDQENGVLQEDQSDQTPQTTSYKSSGNESNTMKSQENTSSGTPPSVQRAPLTKRVSQDPDPIWVLSLLNKLEKQFMLHYADAMAEFKVRWDLDDNEMLDKMISELKEEVHKRIQSSINRELQKIQSRAGRGPRPPGNTLSRNSTVQTEQRRKRLRVMRNKSILSRSDENYTASGTEYSDQRSDDEYCPCDACMKKKMASRAVQRAQALSLAPVMIEFDLQKILQMKKDPAQPTEPKMEEQHTTSVTCAVNKEENNLEVVHEVAEEANDNTRGHKFEMADQEPDCVVNTVDEGKNAENIKDVSVDSETRDPNEEEANYKIECGDVEGGEEEVENEEMVVNVKTCAEEEVEVVEEEAENEGSTEEDCEKKDSPEGDAGNVENNDTAVEAEKEDEMTETGEGIESVDKEAETETGKESTEDKSAEDGGDSKSNKVDTPTEGETSNDESTSEKNAGGNQDGCAEDDANKDGTSDTGRDTVRSEENGKTPKVNIEVEVKGDTENETDKCSSVEEDFEKENDVAVVDDWESTLAKQVTRTSVESQPGSVENCINPTAKLKDLQSFMESVESQGDSMVVITKQPAYKETHGNRKDMCNGLTKWQVSPKISNKASKQKKGQ
ncbi:retinitis pigmentosa 1-like 1 protein [Sinocyclocheilus rhinocerous]|uniref:retinitis pigmentosa 1-like 1 protein n=1 Tax=Sinocyclocheilus rhinocerous TaxID=307959 RepID=UPI0007BA0317|nr:PREDICTED: retinitis pigmentosa 1-like 1 protein [Sinocyclocheilus rhinocerous]